MLKDPKLLNKTLLDYLKSQLLINKKDGVVVHLDGTLMSLVNVYLARQLTDPFQLKLVTCIFNKNKFYLSYLLSLIKDLELVVAIKDLSKDLSTLSFYDNAKEDVAKEISIKKRFIDLMIHIEADKLNLIPLGNLCYSQWCVNFPHRNYQNLEHVYLLNRLYYKELQALAKFLGLPEAIINREPSHYLYKGQIDKKSLRFTYDELEDYLRNAKQSRSSVENIIRDRLMSDNRSRFMNPIIQRPSNILI